MISQSVQILGGGKDNLHFYDILGPSELDLLVDGDEQTCLSSQDLDILSTENNRYNVIRVFRDANTTETLWDHLNFIVEGKIFFLLITFWGLSELDLLVDGDEHTCLSSQDLDILSTENNKYLILKKYVTLLTNCSHDCNATGP